MILTTLTLAAGITLAADLGQERTLVVRDERSLGLSYKDTPAYRTNAAPVRRYRPVRRRAAIPPVPDSNIYDRMAQGIHPFIRVEGIDSPLAMTKEELERWGLESGETIPVSLAAKIIEEKIQRSRE